MKKIRHSKGKSKEKKKKKKKREREMFSQSCVGGGRSSAAGCRSHGGRRSRPVLLGGSGCWAEA
jgi:hypothetical protein